MDRKATAVWQGSIKEGRGEISTESEALNQVAYAFNTRFENQPGTNPEELIAAAHSSCFAMACAAGFTKQGFTPEKLEVNATVSVNKEGESWTVGSSHLDLQAQIPDVTEDQFQKIVEDAKANCPISKLLKAEITLEARLGAAPLGNRSDARPWAPPPAQ